MKKVLCNEPAPSKPKTSVEPLLGPSRGLVSGPDESRSHEGKDDGDVGQKKKGGSAFASHLKGL